MQSSSCNLNFILCASFGFISVSHFRCASVRNSLDSSGKLFYIPECQEEAVEMITKTY